MKVTKYPQSCLVIEDGDKRLLIDPGSLVSGQFAAQDLGEVGAILITHEHQDHVDLELLKALLTLKSVPVIGNASTQNAIGGLLTQVVGDGDEFEAGGFKVTAHELPHCLMVDGSEGPQNTGYVIDGVFFHPGDGTQIEGVAVPNVAAPMAGPDVSPHDVFDLIKSTGAKKVIPIHNDYFHSNVEPISGWINRVMPDVEFVNLENGQSTEL